MATAVELLAEIQSMMRESGINLMELSRRSGIGYSTLQRIKEGRANPTVSMLDRVRSEMLRPAKDGRSCKTCAFDGGTGGYNDGFRLCELAMCAKEGDDACIMHKEAQKDD